jgi:fluoride exporter
VTALDWVAVPLLGGIAALARFMLISSPRWNFYTGTFIVNISGSLILGLLAGAVLSGNAEILLGSATIGSYTTFSTWIFETHHLAKDNKHLLAAANVLLSTAVGLGALALGHVITG